MLFLVGCIEKKSTDQDNIARARESYSKGFYLEAEKEYERYLQVEPQGEFRTEAWNRLSEIAITTKGDLDRAVVLLDAMYLELGTDPDDAWHIMFQLGDVYTQLGDRTKAVECFEKCLVHAASSPEKMYTTQIRMAKLYRLMGNYELVVDMLENCADSAVDDNAKARCLYELAQNYSLISNWNQSKRILESLLQLNQVDEEIRVLAIFLLADIYDNERNYRKTKKLLESISKTYPNPKVIELRLANLPYIPPSKDATPPRN